METVKISVTFHQPDAEKVAKLLGVIMAEICPKTDVGQILEELILQGLGRESDGIAELNIDVGTKSRAVANVEG